MFTLAAIPHEGTTSGGLLGLLGRLKAFRITKWATSSDGNQESVDEREPADILFGANVVSSLRTDAHWKEPHHAVLLDLDVPAYLVPSHTPGHSHLYIDVSIPQSLYFNLLTVLADCGVVEDGYVDASKSKGGTFLRLPWKREEGK